MNHSNACLNPGHRVGWLVLPSRAPAAIIGFLGYSSMASPSDATPPAIAKPNAGTTIDLAAPDSPADDGRIHGEVTVFDDDSAAVANLDPDLLKALRAAATDAALMASSSRSTAAGVHDLPGPAAAEAISKYGSKAEAARWVATPETSPHVSGDAVDLGKVRGHGVAGRSTARVRAVPDLWQRAMALRAPTQGCQAGCPQMYADPTHDPRMQQT